MPKPMQDLEFEEAAGAMAELMLEACGTFANEHPDVNVRLNADAIAERALVKFRAMWASDWT